MRELLAGFLSTFFLQIFSEKCFGHPGMMKIVLVFFGDTDMNGLTYHYLIEYRVLNFFFIKCSFHFIPHAIL